MSRPLVRQLVEPAGHPGVRCCGVGLIPRRAAPPPGLRVEAPVLARVLARNRSHPPPRIYEQAESLYCAST